MKYLFSYIPLIMIIVLVSNVTLSQTKDYKNLEIGIPFLNYYTPEDYNAGGNNWCIAQDKNGIMYFGNINNGLLEFDGASWRFIKVPNNSTVRAIAIDDSNKVFVTAYQDFGYLAPDSIGKLKFNSLKSHINKNSRNIGEVWDVVANSKGVYFKTSSKMFRWNGNKLFFWDSLNAFRLYKIGDDVYTRGNGIGLMKIVGDSLKLMPDGDYFSSIGVFDMIQYQNKLTNKKNILITTNRKGLFYHDGNKFHQFKTEADSLLIKSQIYNTCLLNNGDFAFATQRGGVIIINQNGQLVNVFNENHGLPINVVYDVFQDNSNGLWLATSKGIVHLEYPSSLSKFPQKEIIKNTVTNMLRINNTLYGVNDLGTIFFNYKSSSFELVKGINKPSFFLNYSYGDVFVGTNSGLGIIKDGKISEWILNNSSNQIVTSKYYPGRIYVGHRQGITILQKISNSNKYKAYLTNYDEEALVIVEDIDSSLWIQSFETGVKHTTKKLNNLNENVINNLSLHSYTAQNGLPGDELNIFNIEERVLLATNKGTYKFNKINNSFELDSTLGSNFTDSTKTILLLKKSYNDDFWAFIRAEEKYEIGKIARQNNGKYKWVPKPQLNRIKLHNVQYIYPDYNINTEKEKLWISSPDGLFIYNPELEKSVNIDYSTFIRNIKIKNDSTIYGGHYHSKYIPVISYSNNDITFEVSSTSFNNPSTNNYQYLLEGNDDTWSKWTHETKKVYTNLSEGDYKFRARSKNIYGVIGKEDFFIFKILHPWYLTWWAFLIYLFFFGLTIFLIDRVMRKRLINRERNKAKLREAELIKNQAEELETVDKLVRVINKAEDLENLFNSLLKQTLSFIPQAEKAAVFLLDKKDSLFKVAYTAGYKVRDLEKISFTADELLKRYSRTSDEVEKGIFIVNNTKELYGDKKMSAFSKAKSMLVMAVERDENLEAYVVFDSFSDKSVFDSSTASILNRFREHAVSAISKAQTLKKLQEKNEEIIRTQEQLVVQQKLASLGALTAGIAHEIKNPLNFVNNFAEISSEMLEELTEIIKDEKEKISKNKYETIQELISFLEKNISKINRHGKRADSIIKSMLLHSRGSTEEKSLININELLEQYVNLTYHGLRAQNKEFNITIEKDYADNLENINVRPQEISRVFLNVINNACYAVNEKKIKSKNNFEPKLKISTKSMNGKLEIRIKDNGNGIPDNIKDKIFQPFFTTKPAGEGTGLGLSLSYDIITKVHNGELKVETKEGEGTTFIILLTNQN